MTNTSRDKNTKKVEYKYNRVEKIFTSKRITTYSELSFFAIICVLKG
jgi:hypothetical protein